MIQVLWRKIPPPRSHPVAKSQHLHPLSPSQKKKTCRNQLFSASLWIFAPSEYLFCHTSIKNGAVIVPPFIVQTCAYTQNLFVVPSFLKGYGLKRTCKPLLSCVLLSLVWWVSTASCFLIQVLWSLEREAWISLAVSFDIHCALVWQCSRNELFTPLDHLKIEYL